MSVNLMNTIALLAILLGTRIEFSHAFRAENQEQIRQLLETKSCPGCYLALSDLSHKNLSRANLEEAILSSSFLFETNLSHSNLKEINLGRASLGAADLSHCNLENAILSWTNLNGANLANSNLSNVDLTAADMMEVNLTGTILTNANLSRVNLTGTDLSGAINLETAYLCGALMPDGSISFQGCQEKAEFRLSTLIEAPKFLFR